MDINELIKNWLALVKSYGRYCKPYIFLVNNLIEENKNDKEFKYFDNWFILFKLCITIKVHKINMQVINIIDRFISKNNIIDYHKKIQIKYEYDSKSKKLIELKEIKEQKIILFIFEIFNYNLENNLDKYDELINLTSVTLYNILIKFFNEVNVNFLNKYFIELFQLYEKSKTELCKKKLTTILKYSNILICEKLKLNENKLKNKLFKKSLIYDKLENYLSLYLNIIVDNVELNIMSNKDEIKLLVPKNLDEYDKIDYDLLNLKVLNEKKFENGIFGWCIICRKKANLYCKETKIPICSFECKFKNINFENEFTLSKSKILNMEKNEIEFNSNFNLLLELLLDLSFKDIKKKNKRNKSKIIFINLFKIYFKKFGKNFYKNLDLIIFIKTKFIKNILELCSYSDESLFKTSISLIKVLILNMKIFLKTEIGMILEDIVIKILDSSNAKYFYKFVILKFIKKLFEDNEICMQIFFNFDCKNDSQIIFQILLNLLVKISQGKYLNNVYSNIISQEEEKNLRVLSNEILFDFVKGLENLLNEEEFEEISLNEDIGTNLQLKEQMEIEIYNFNKKGNIRYINNLARLGVIENTPESIAEFFRDKRLSLISIGIIFGDEKEISLKILEEFLKKENYKEISLTAALKSFLSKFQLPGEGQKIDRILNYFSKRYYEENPDTISLDAIEKINYLLMYLQTNLHNPQIKEKMDLKKFISMASDIKSEGKEIDKELLNEYFNFIYKEPIAIHVQERKKLEKLENMKRSFKEKQNLFTNETKNIVEKMNFYFENLNISVKNLEQYYNFKEINDTRLIDLFIEKIWNNLYGFFSSTIIKYNENNYLKKFTNSIISMIKLTDKYQFPTEREAFILILVQYSGLNRIGITLNEKNIVFIKALEEISINIGNHLHSSWTSILDCFLNLNYYSSKKDKLNDENDQSIDKKNCEFIYKFLNDFDLEKIFIFTKKLNDNSIIEFWTGLSELNIKEVNKKDFNKSFYGLNKLLEIIMINKNRNIVIKNRTIKIIEDTFIKIFDIIQNEKNTTMIFINILKNIIVEFLENIDFSKNNFQEKIFNIYLKILENDYIQIFHLENLLNCILYTIQKYDSNIKDGYIIILEIILIAIEKIKFIKETNESYDYNFLFNIIINIINLFNHKFENKIKYLVKKLYLINPICQKLISVLDYKNNLEIFKYLNNLFNIIFIDNLVDDDTKNEIKKYNEKTFSNKEIFIKNVLFKSLICLINNNEINNSDYGQRIDQIFQNIYKIEKYLNFDLLSEFLNIVFKDALKIQIKFFIKNQDEKEKDLLKKMIIFTIKNTFALILLNNDILLIKEQFIIIEENLKNNENNTILISNYIDFLKKGIDDIFKKQKDFNDKFIDLIYIVIGHLNYLLVFLLPKELINNKCKNIIDKNEKPYKIQNSNIDFNVIVANNKIKFILDIIRWIQIILNNSKTFKLNFKNIYKGLNIVINFSKEFNDNKILRYYLWRNEYFNKNNYLPSLNIIIKIFNYIEIIKFNNKILNKNSLKNKNKFLDYSTDIFNLYINNHKKLVSGYKNLNENKKEKVFDDEIINKEFYSKIFLEQQNILIDLLNFIDKQLFNKLNEIIKYEEYSKDKCLKNKLIKLWKIIQTFLFIPKVNNNLFKCFNCMECKNCNKYNNIDMDNEGFKFVNNLTNNLLNNNN